MSEEEWRQLAWLCGSEIPQNYVDLIANYPVQLIGAARTSDLDSETDRRSVSDVELLSQISDVVRINQEARSVSLLEPDGSEFFWPEQLLIVGETGTGDYYCIDVSGDCPGVLQYRHLPLEFEVIADSLEEFVDMVLDAFGESPDREE